MTKDIVGYEGLYFADIDGNIFSYPKKTRKGIRKITPSISKSGYLLIDLCINGVIKKYSVHRLIALAFINNPLSKEQVNHINGNKTDNRVINLEWNTRSENQRHSISIGLRSTNGIKNSQSKLNDEQVLSIFNDKRLYKDISSDYGVSIITVSNIKSGYSWNHITKMKRIRKK